MKDLEELLYNTDFSQDCKSKEAVKDRLLNTLKYGGKISMKKNRFRPYAAAAAAIVTVGVLIAACGEDMIEFARQFTVGRYASFVAPDDSANKRNSALDGSPVPFDYEAEIEWEKGIVTYFDTIGDVKPYLAFNPLMPVSLPIGFAIDRICLYNDENGQLLPLGSNMYLSVNYTNKEKTQQIYMQFRLMNEETGFVASGNHDMRYISINGHDGVVDSTSVNVEIDGVMYMIIAGKAESVTQDDLIRMAKSLK